MKSHFTNTSNPVDFPKIENTVNNNVYVIAGNYQEFLDWHNERVSKSIEELTKTEYTYVNVAGRLKGLKDIHGFFVGSYKDRKDIFQICMYLASANNKPVHYYYELVGIKRIIP